MATGILYYANLSSVSTEVHPEERRLNKVRKETLEIIYGNDNMVKPQDLLVLLG